MANLILVKPLALISGLVMSFCAATVYATEDPPTESLYDRLGGTYPIAVVVDTFIDLLLVNDVLNANPAIKEARDRVPPAGIKFHVATLICQETGGPCQYVGRTMYDAHSHLNIGETEWRAMMTDFTRTLNNYGVPSREQRELAAIMESKKKEIIVR